MFLVDSWVAGVVDWGREKGACGEMKKIRIGGLDFEVVKEQKQFVVNYVASDGYVDYDNCKIRVWSGCSKDYANQTLCHEIIHGIIRQFNVPIPEEQNEQITEALGKGLHQVLKDNKNILF